MENIDICKEQESPLMRMLLWIWDIPLNFFGFILSRFAYCNIGIVGIPIYFTTGGFSITLGKYIILNNDHRPSYKSQNGYMFDYIIEDDYIQFITHEVGHSIQSQYCGIFFILIKLFEWTRCIYAVIFHMYDEDIDNWYSNGFPEMSQDILADDFCKKYGIGTYIDEKYKNHNYNRELRQY